MKEILFVAIFFLLPISLFAQVRKVSGEYTYYSDPSQSAKEAMAAAIENARVQALAKEFGTLVSQDFVQSEEQKNGQENSLIMQLSSSEVKGEWLEDLKEPETKILATMPNGIMVIEAKVSGRARGLSNEAVDFEALALRNGTEPKFADTNFNENDNLYLYFQAPVNGYVAVYLVDEMQNAYCLLPYADDADGQQPVVHGKEYVFFSRSHEYDVPKKWIDECYVTCDDDRMEHNRIFVLFSPNPFTKAVDRQGKHTDKERILPRQLSYKDFTRWMSRLCARDTKMGRKVIRLIVRK